MKYLAALIANAMAPMVSHVSAMEDLHSHAKIIPASALV